jgi:antitoxin component YwqK of YwqJK toxin-antitoxin module
MTNNILGYTSAGQYLIKLQINKDNTNINKDDELTDNITYKCNEAYVLDIHHKITKSKREYVYTDFNPSLKFQINSIIKCDFTQINFYKNEERAFYNNLLSIINNNLYTMCQKTNKIIEPIKYTGKYYEWYDDGKILLETTFEDSLLNGIYIRYHNNGKKHVEALFNMGDIDGDVLLWNKYGELM